MGIYSPFRAGALAGVSGNRIGRWARYGLIRPTVHHGRPANLYEFRDVAEAIVVHLLIDRRFSYEDIHRAIDHARAEYGEWPLLSAPLGVARHAIEGDPRGAVVLRVTAGVYVDTADGRANQIILKPELLEEVADMLRAGGWIARALGLRRIEVDPGKLGGTPVVRGRRWPIERVAQLAADETGEQILVDEYGLDRRDVAESVRWMKAAAEL